MKPITPAEAENKRIEAIDPAMIQAVNELIVENLKSGHATVQQKEIVKRYFQVVDKQPTEKAKSDLFDRNQLDFEDVFRKAGWAVEYDKPGYNESYEAFFVFKKKRKD
jgi:hypothetical protein